MKRVFYLIIVLILFSYLDVSSLSKNDLKVLNLEPITTINKPIGYTSVQGGTTTDKYIITLLINDDREYSDNKTSILILNKDNYKLVRLPKNPIVKYDFRHANDATYNKNTNELVILSGKSINFMDLNNDSFELVRKIKLKKYYHGIGYDEINNRYVLARSIKKGTLFEIRDSNFNLINKFKIKTNLTRQSLTVYNSNIYYVCYEAGMLTKHQSVYDGILKRKENLIYVYDLEGNKKNIFYIPFSYKDIVYGEIENISFNNDKMLLQFNHSSNIGYFTALYRPVEVNVEIEVEEKKNHLYVVSSNDKEILRVKSKDNLIKFRLNYDKEGIYKYQINRITNKNYNEDSIENKLEIEVYYDSVFNKLKVRSNHKNLVLKKDSLFIKDNYLRETFIEAPDTGIK